MRTSILFFLIFLQLILIPNGIAGSTIYKHVDKDGNITFTNRPIPNAEKISIASFSRESVSQSRPQSASNLPKVKDSTQNDRDLTRRKILEKELVTEEKLFADTQNSLDQISIGSDINNSTEKVVQLKNKLFLHQRNISALKKELGR
ncbi:DUF4124 domain-containing protein [Nitrosomonas sp. sh817]|uniref:DUF4124 domain-containing protein n=1 Tax=Nitrosomonas sp. sh817 TaxID=3070658 RepID=UPI0027DE95F5|nr:DUF4124 domain-containing protein [Nitrosomonas sp. sh817]WMJ09587.1 DUF4124 domain-containing protein [Nitrosomonas sp. sh817]